MEKEKIQRELAWLIHYSMLYANGRSERNVISQVKLLAKLIGIPQKECKEFAEYVWKLVP